MKGGESARKGPKQGDYWTSECSHKTKRRHTMKTLALIIFFLTLAFTVHASSFDKSVSSTLQATSKEINKSLPVRVDKEKILETTVAIKNILIIKYKVTDDSTFKDPRFDIKKYTYHFRNSVGESTCRDEGTFALLKRGAAYNYIFINQYGQKLFDFLLNERECSDYLSGRR
jgi:hypothetical protein